MTESIYTIWFIIFNIKIKNEYFEPYGGLTEYAITMLDQLKMRVIFILILNILYKKAY